MRFGAHSIADYAARNFPEDTLGLRPLVLSVCSTPRTNFISFVSRDIRVRTNTIFRFEDASPIRPWTQLAGETLEVTATLTLAHTPTSTQVFMAGRHVLCQHIRGVRPLPRASFSFPVNSRPSRRASTNVRGSGVGLLLLRWVRRVFCVVLRYVVSVSSSINA